MHRTAARTEEVALQILHEAHPDRPNATNVDFWASVVLTGAGGKAFVSGADISRFESERANLEGARAYGAKAELTYTTGYPVLVNEERKTAFAAGVAREVAGKDKVNTDCAPLMGAEDFAFMLQERPGAFIYIGNGNSAQLHNPAYDFNDEAIPVGTSYWVRLAETALAG